jgi:adenylate cyclase
VTPQLLGTGLDPAPRKYVAGVLLVRRVANGIGAAPPCTTLADIEHWLLHEATQEKDWLAFLESFVWRLVVAGLPLDRVTLHMGTLHPQLVGFAWNWSSADQIFDELKIADAAAATPSFLRSPIYRVFESGETSRRDPRDPKAAEEFPILADLARDGYVDFIALPLSSSGRRNAMTIATRRVGGFTDLDLKQLQPLISLFALHFERHNVLRISSNALGAYIGTGAAAKVLAGSIKRGLGEAVHAVVWVADLRGFTELSDRLQPADLITLLNAYFEVMAGAVLKHSGDVLKFIGDGLLAVFAFENFATAADAARAALEAARDAQRGLEMLNTEPSPELAAIDGWRPLRAGIALNEGEVFFGNIGAPERLDFTVIGAAVNEASRVEALQKTLKRNILITEAVARRLDSALDHLGAHQVRGVSAPISIYSPREAADRETA